MSEAVGAGDVQVRQEQWEVDMREVGAHAHEWSSKRKMQMTLLACTWAHLIVLSTIKGSGALSSDSSV